MEWTPPIRPRPSRKQHYILVLPDAHIGYSVEAPTYSIAAWDLAMQALSHYRKRLTHVVFLGDVGSWESLSHWSALRADQAFVEEDVALVNARLDEVEAITSPQGIKVVFCEGNHEAWAGLYEAKYPALRDMVNLKRRLRFKQRGWTWVPEGHFWAVGDVHFCHGHLRGARQPLDLVRLTGVSVIAGHLHTYSTQSMRTLTGEHAAWTMGCLASLNPSPPYTRGAQLDRWVQGFGLVQVRTCGLFQVSFRRIISESWTELEDGTELRTDLQACRQRYAQDQKIRAQLRKEYGDRFYQPGGPVVRTEPHHGRTNADHTVARTRRARIVRMLPT